MLMVTDYGARPDSGEDATLAIQNTIEAASAKNEPVIIVFPKGRYDMYPDQAAKEIYYVSNTVSEEEHPDPTKIIGLLLKKMQHVTVEGNGSLLMFHGRMTPIILDDCDDVVFRNMDIDFERPTMSEMRVDAFGDHYWDVTVHPDSHYELRDGLLNWVGEGWLYRGGPAQQFDMEYNTTQRVPNPIMEAIRIEEIANRKLRLSFETAPYTTVGRVYQMRDGIRSSGCLDEYMPKRAME